MSNNTEHLALAVINDGATYQARVDAARAELSGTYKPEWREFTRAKADELRRQFGERFSAAAIRDAALSVSSYMIRSELEGIASKYDGKPIFLTVRRWRDRVYGNSYFSARIHIPQGGNGELWSMVNVPFQYGYGSQPEHEAFAVLKRIGIDYSRGEFGGHRPFVLSDHGDMKRSEQFSGIYI